VVGLLIKPTLETQDERPGFLFMGRREHDDGGLRQRGHGLYRLGSLKASMSFAPERRNLRNDFS
jgi:hypothetical protein